MDKSNNSDTKQVVCQAIGRTPPDVLRKIHSLADKILDMFASNNLTYSEAASILSISRDRLKEKSKVVQ